MVWGLVGPGCYNVACTIGRLTVTSTDDQSKCSMRQRRVIIPVSGVNAVSETGEVDSVSSGIYGV